MPMPTRGGPPMPPRPGGGPPGPGGPGAPPPGRRSPPPGGPPQGAPPPGGEAQELKGQEDTSKIEAIAAAAPRPTKPFSVARMKSMSQQLDKTVDAVAGGDIPVPEWTPPDGFKGNWAEPLPPEIYAPFFVVMEAVKAVSAQQGGAFDKHVFAAEEMLDDASLTQGIARLKSIAKDKKLKEALMQGLQAGGQAPGDEKPGPPRPKGPKEMSPEDEKLAGAL